MSFSSFRKQLKKGNIVIDSKTFVIIFNSRAGGENNFYTKSIDDILNFKITLPRKRRKIQLVVFFTLFPPFILIKNLSPLFVSSFFSPSPF